MPGLRTASLALEILFACILAGVLSCIYVAWPQWQGFEYEGGFDAVIQLVMVYLAIRATATVVVWLWEIAGLAKIQGETLALLR
jgi:hypothetical protein